MKQLVPIVLTVLVVCCKPKQAAKDNLIQEHAEAYLKPNLNDPDSYEFADMQLIDSTTYRQNIDFEKDDLRREIETDKSLGIPTAKSRKLLTGVLAIEKTLGVKSNQLAAYKYQFRFRCKNGFGAKTLNNYTLQVTPAPEYRVLIMTDNPDKLYLMPNEFPGYRRLVNEIYK